MRIVVFSDSHGSYTALRQVVLAQPGAEAFLHLGDGEREFDDLRFEFSEKMFRGVAGNCDWGSTAKYFDLVVLEGKRIYFTHGHAFGVKAGLGGLLHAAREVRAHVALYGHTHVPHTEYVDGLYVMNPGSIALPREGAPSCGVIDITPAGIVTNIVRLPSGRR